MKGDDANKLNCGPLTSFCSNVLDSNDSTDSFDSFTLVFRFDEMTM